MDEHLAFLPAKFRAQVRLAALSFVAAYKGRWGHADWEHFLGEIAAQTGVKDLAKAAKRDSIGRHLEELKALYLKEGEEGFARRVAEARHRAFEMERIPDWLHSAAHLFQKASKAFLGWLGHLWKAELKAENLPRAIPLPVRGLLGTLFPVIKLKYVLVILGAVIGLSFAANALRYRAVASALEERRFEDALEAAARLEATFKSRLHAANPLEALWLRPAFRRLKDEQVAFAAYEVGELKRLGRRTALFTELPDVPLLDLSLEEHRDELAWNDRPSAASLFRGREPGLALLSDDGALQTILLEVWAWQVLSKRPHPLHGALPVVVSLADFVGDSPELAAHLVSSVRSALKAHGSDVPPEVVVSRAARGGLLLVLTHLEASGDPLRTAAAVRALAVEPAWERNRWWVGFRVDRSLRALRPSLSPLVELWASDFQESQVAEVVRSTFPMSGDLAASQLRGSPRLAQSLRNPLVMAMFLKHYRRHRAVPERLGSFYQAVAADALATEAAPASSSSAPSSGKDEETLAPQAKELLLGSLAEAIGPSRESAPRYEAEGAVARSLGLAEAATVAAANKASRTLGELLKTPLLITDAAPGSWSSSHQVRFLLPSFRDYFHARAASRRLPAAERRGEAESELAVFLDSPAMGHSAGFLVGLLDDSTVVFDKLLARARASRAEGFPRTSRRYLRLAARLFPSAVAVEESTARELTAELVKEAQAAPSASDRKRALEHIGYVRREASLEALSEALKDPDPEVRRAAVVGMERYGGAEVVAPLVAVLMDGDSSVRARGARALSLAPRERAVPALEELLQGGSAAVRVQAVSALGQVGGEESARVLERALADEDRLVRRFAVRALGQAARPESLGPLASALKDPEEAVRAEAAQALGSLAAPGALEALAGALGDESLRVKEAAAQALGAIGTEDAVRKIERAMGGSGIVEQRVFVQALGRAASPRAQETLQRLVVQAEPSVQTAAIQALGQMRAPRTVEVLSDALKGMDASVQREAALTLRHLKDRRATGALKELLASGDPLIRAEAVSGLGELGDPSAAAAVARSASDEDPGVRAAAAWALGRLGGEEAVRSLAGLASDAEAGVRGAALEGLAAQAGASFEPLFIKGLADPDSGVRYSAAAALERAASAQAVSALLERAGDPDPFARREVVRVLGVVGGMRALPALVERMAEADPSIRAEAARSLRRIGSPALPRLEALLARGGLAKDVEEEVNDLSVVLEGGVDMRDGGELASLAGGYAESGQPRRAVALYRKAISLAATPERRSKLHAALGEALMSMGEVQAARKAYQRSLELDPSNSRALNALKAQEAAQAPVGK